MVAFVLGFLIAGIAIAMAKDVKLPPRGFAIGMAVLPAVYMLFALLAGDMRAIGLEFLYGLPFFIIAFVATKNGFKASGIVVVALWGAHGAYDVYHHLLVDNAGVPGWYPVFCLAFDAAILAYLSVMIFTLRDMDIIAGQPRSSTS